METSNMYIDLFKYKEINIANNVVQYATMPTLTHFKFPFGVGYSVQSYMIKGLDKYTYQLASMMGSSEGRVTSQDVFTYLNENYLSIKRFFEKLEKNNGASNENLS